MYGAYILLEAVSVYWHLTRVVLRKEQGTGGYEIHSPGVYTTTQTLISLRIEVLLLTRVCCAVRALHKRSTAGSEEIKVGEVQLLLSDGID